MATTKLPNPILMACARRAPDVVLALLAHRITPKVDLDELDADGVSALGRLVFHQYGYDEEAQAARALIQAGADPMVEVRDLDHDRGASSRPNIPVALAAARRGRAMCSLIFEALGPANLKKISSAHPLLHTCVAANHLELARVLIEAGADVNQAFSGSGLAICKSPSPGMFALLVAAGAKVNLLDDEGRSGLQVLGACASAEISAMAIQAAQAEAGGKVATFAEGRDIPKSKASDDIAAGLTFALFEAIDSRKAERTRLLWERLGLGRDKRRLLGARDARGRTLLHAAIASRSFSLATRLIKRGLSVNDFDDDNQTPASILADLSLSNKERDPHGTRRGAFAAKVFEAVDWSARSPNNRSMFEALLGTSFESINNINGRRCFDQALAAAGDWLALDADGSCLLSRCVEALRTRRYLKSSDDFLGMLHRIHGVDKLILAHSARPEFAAAAAGLLRAACSADSAQVWSSRGASGGIDDVLDAIHQTLPSFANVDPESIDWAPELAERSPQLHAAVETWRLESLGLSRGGARAKARAL